MADEILTNLTTNGVQDISEEDLATLKLFQEYPEGLMKFASVCCILYILVGIPGNLLTIIALSRCKKIRNATAIFIINLSSCDLLHCFFNIPFIASTFWTRSWPYGAFLCRLLPLTRYALVCVSLTTVLAITINRYVMIAHPCLYARIFQQRNLRIIVAAIWIYSFGMLIPTWLEIWGRFGMDTTIGFCSVIPDQANRSPVKVLFLSAFVIPCIAIIICYGRMFFIVRKATVKSVNSRRYKSRNNLNDISSELSNAVERSPDSDVETTHLSPPKLIINSDDESSTLKVDIRHARITELTKRFRSSAVRIPRNLIPTSKDKKLLAMITIITLSFFVCNLPITLVQIVSELGTIPEIWTLSYLLRYSSTCINPILYVLMSNEYRKAYKKVFFRRKQNG